MQKKPWDLFMYKEKTKKDRFELLETKEDDSDTGANTSDSADKKSIIYFEQWNVGAAH